MNTSINQRTTAPPTASPGVEIHIVDAEGRPMGGVFTRYRLDIEPSEGGEGVDLVVELYDMAGGSTVVVIASGLVVAGHAEKLRRAVAEAIVSRSAIGPETFVVARPESNQ